MKLKMLIGLLLLIMLSGCANFFGSPYVPPANCVDQPSVVLDTFPDPRPLDRALLTVQFAALEQIKGYDEDDAIAVLDEVEAKGRELQEKGATALTVVSMIKRYLNIANKYAGAAVFVFGDELDQLNKPLPLSECDWGFFYTEIERQRVLVELHRE